MEGYHTFSNFYSVKNFIAISFRIFVKNDKKGHFPTFEFQRIVEIGYPSRLNEKKLYICQISSKSFNI